MVMNVQLKPSYRLACLLITAHVATAAGVFMLDLPFELRMALACVVLLSLVATVQRSALLRTRDAIVALEWNEDRAVNFQTRDGLWHAARLLPTTFVTPFLTVIDLRTQGTPRIRHVVMMTDSAAPDEYRRLRVRLQWDNSGYA
ncbi:MAG: protein YgfX [Rhodospirillaceae bacterium]